MTVDDNFEQYAQKVIRWIADYRENIECYPVKSPVNPGDINKRIDPYASDDPETFEKIFNDFIDNILPGVTHWQHPKFFAYFPTNTSVPSILAEFLVAALNVQCMSWQTSPAAAELEESVMGWFRKMLGLPDAFHGVIQSGASMATLCAILTARESITFFRANHEGLYAYANTPLTIYCSTEAHSSVIKAARVAGFGDRQVRRIIVDAHFRMDAGALLQAIKKDIEEGCIPTCIIVTMGTTSSGAMDPLEEITRIAGEYKIWIHVDAAYGGTAFILPEYQHHLKGIEDVDSFVVNPHKWLFTNFDCTAYFIKDKEKLIRTFSINPEYLQTKEDGAVNNYRDWGIELGRRFRALKLWFVIKYYGLTGLQNRVRNHIKLAHYLVELLRKNPHFEILEPINLNIICFRLVVKGNVSNETMNQVNKKFMEKLNATNKIYLTHTVLNDQVMLRIVASQTSVTKKHIDETWSIINLIAEEIIAMSNFNPMHQNFI